MKIKQDTFSHSLFFKWILFFFIPFPFIKELHSAVDSTVMKIDSMIYLADIYFNESKYDSSSACYILALKISKETNEVGRMVKSQIGLANCSNALGNYSQAFLFSTQGLDLINQHGLTNSAWLANLYYLKGNAEYKLRHTNESIQSLNYGIDIYKENIEHDSIYTLLYKTLGNNYLILRNLDEAKSAYEFALNNELNNKDTGLLAASLIMNIGIIYSNKAEYIKGEEYFEKSLKIKERKSPNGHKSFANNYLNLGRLQTIIGKLDDALTNLNIAENIYTEKLGLESDELIPIYLNKGALYILRMEYDKAITYHEKALELSIRDNSKGEHFLNQIYVNLGFINKKLGNYTKAIEWLKKAEQINNTAKAEIINFRTIANCYEETGEFEKAKQYYELAINTALEFKNRQLHELKYCFRDYGIFNDKMGNYEIAENYLMKATELIRQDFGETNTVYANSLTILGEHFYLKGSFSQALKYYQKSLIIDSKNFYDTSIYLNPTKDQITADENHRNTFQYKAKALYSLYNLKSKNERDLIASYKTSKLAIDVFENMRTGFTHEKSKLFATKDSKGIFELAIKTTLDLAETTRDSIYTNMAFYLSEKGKSAVLLSSMQESKALSFGGIPANILKLESKLKNEIAIYTNLIYDENLKQIKNKENLSLWRDLLIKQNRAYDSLITLFESKYPEYYQLKYDNSGIDISALQSNLTDREVLIEYELLDSILVIFTITNTDINYFKVNINENFINDVNNYIGITHEYPNVENANERLKYFASIANSLYSVLIDPIRDKIKDKKEIIIIPDDVLGLISFESLIVHLPSSEISGYDKLDYLINDYCIRYSYSASLLLRKSKKPVKTTKILAMAPSYSEDYVLPITRQGFGLRLAPLDYAKNEVENIQKYYSCKILEGNNATEKNFKKIAKDFNILHFSMHTIINNLEPMASKLVFSLNNDTVDDGFLNTYEIYNLPINADLAVLSSCETGGGKLSSGEGILSLARGFIYSGVSSIVMTLWEIDDISSADIMSGFYKRLKEGEKIDEALRNSKLNYFHTSDQLHAHPYFWSAYIQIGDNSPIAANSFSIKKWLIVALILIVVIVLFLLKRRRN